jgi:hypothetical protein
MNLPLPFPLMRPMKRLLVFISELGILIVGIILSFAISLWIAFSNDCRSECPLAEAVLGGGVILTIGGFILRRRKTRPWKIQYDAAGFLLMQAERKLNPARIRHRRLARLVLVCVPAILATFVMFFLPVATHLVHPGPRYFKHYQVAIPWNFPVFLWQWDGGDSGYVTVIAATRGRGRFGITPFRVVPFWLEDRLSIMTLSVGGKTAMPGTTAHPNLGISFECYQSDFRPGAPWLFRLLGSGAVWEANCEARQPIYQQDLYAHFVGCEEDLAAFYKIVKSVRPVE